METDTIFGLIFATLLLIVFYLLSKSKILFLRFHSLFSNSFVNNIAPSLIKKSKIFCKDSEWKVLEINTLPINDTLTRYAVLKRTTETGVIDRIKISTENFPFKGLTLNYIYKIDHFEVKNEDELKRNYFICTRIP